MAERYFAPAPDFSISDCPNIRDGLPAVMVRKRRICPPSDHETVLGECAKRVENYQRHRENNKYELILIEQHSVITLGPERSARGPRAHCIWLPAAEWKRRRKTHLDNVASHADPSLVAYDYRRATVG